ncbi:MAG: nitronate monooxygenase, partial [Dehalococcoidia bacterium]
SVDGFECGGHPGEDDIPNFVLLPRAAEELTIPFVSSGGMADGRSLVASLAMGAEGMNMGTRFIATQEAPGHPNVKQALVDASELDTRLIMRGLRNTERVLNNAGVERLIEKERNMGADLKFQDIMSEVAGVYPKVMQDGDMDAGAWSCGMVAGLIRDVPTVKELIDRIMSEAEEIITKRLAGPRVAVIPTTGRYFQVPYRIMVPAEVENLLVAGRSVSGDRLSHAATRQMMCCTVTGQGAGVAAAVSVKDGVTCREVDIARVQRRREKQGVRIR